MCRCRNVSMGSFANQVTLVPKPEHVRLVMNDGCRTPREAVCVDTCLAAELRRLWRRGIRTTGCCCGHNLQFGYIGVDERDIPRMAALGYQPSFNRCGPGRSDSFFPRTRGCGNGLGVRVKHALLRLAQGLILRAAGSRPWLELREREAVDA